MTTMHDMDKKSTQQHDQQHAHEDGPPSYSHSTSEQQPLLTDLLVRHQAPINTALGYTYTPMQQMTVLPPSRNAENVPLGLDGTREWSNALCSCCERPALVLGACLCPCVFYSGNKMRMQSLTMKGAPHPHPASAGYGLWCCLYALSPQAIGLGQAALQCLSRFQTRARYRIQGDLVQDALISVFCTCCTLIQERREIEAEEQYLNQMAQQGETPTMYTDADVPVEGDAGFAV